MRAVINAKVKIPHLLQGLHGEYATPFELIIPYFTGIVMAIAIIISTNSYSLSFGKRLVLALLTIDIAGGVIANFTSGTNVYYTKRPNLRKIYILIHVVQPLVLSYVFPSELCYLGIIFLYTLLSTFLVNFIERIMNQRLIAAMLYTFGMLLLHWLSFSFILSLLCTLFMLKLMVGFGVRWEESEH